MKTFSEAVKQDNQIFYHSESGKIHSSNMFLSYCLVFINYDYIALTHIQFSLEIARRHIMLSLQFFFNPMYKGCGQGKCK